MPSMPGICRSVTTMSTAWPARSRIASASCPEGASTTRAVPMPASVLRQQVALVAVVVDDEEAQAPEIDRLRMGSKFDHAELRAECL